MLSSLPVGRGQLVDAAGSYSHILTPAYIRDRLPSAVLIVLIMFLLKRHYSLAGADQLDWILAPTARLVAWLTSAQPVLEHGVGYVDFARGIIVAPACAGVNFMIMAFGLAAFYGLSRTQLPINRPAWLALSFAGGYGLALIVNAVRIALSMVLYKADIYTGWLTVERVHRLMGVGLYLGALWLYFCCLRQIMAWYCRGSRHQNSRGDIGTSGWLTSGWYLLGAVGVPLANQVWQQGRLSFGEHCITVVLATLAICTVAVLVKRLFKIPQERLSRLLTALYLKGCQQICRQKC